MHWTNKSEKENIKRWAGEYFTDKMKKQYLPMPDSVKESYWCKYDGNRDIVDYNFETISEIEKILQEELKEDFYEDLILHIAVAAFKEKEIIQIDENINKNNQTLDSDINNFTIPEFIYTF